MSIIVQARNPSGSRASALTGSGMHVSQNPIESRLLLEELQGLGSTKAPRGDACDKVDVDLAARVRLVFAGELAPALWALPHGVSLAAGVLMVSTG